MTTTNVPPAFHVLVKPRAAFAQKNENERRTTEDEGLAVAPLSFVTP